MNMVMMTMCALMGSAVGIPAEWNEKSRAIESKQVAFWDAKLEAARQNPPLSRILELSLGLKNMGYRKSLDGHSEDVDIVYEELQSELLLIPGHARYFLQELRREQEMVKDYPTSTGPRVSYDSNRSLYFETLCHLPSPETVAVLGELLSDETDAPDPRVEPDDCGPPPPANSFVSSRTISTLGLRDFPVEEKTWYLDPSAHLAKTRAWWEEVKAGRKTFSFEGQKVAYRFKPDGTWEMIALARLPNESIGKEGGRTEKRPERASRERGGNLTADGGARSWNWLVLALLLALIAGIWIVSRRPFKTS